MGMGWMAKALALYGIGCVFIRSALRGVQNTFENLQHAFGCAVGLVQQTQRMRVMRQSRSNSGMQTHHHIHGRAQLVADHGQQVVFAVLRTLQLL